MTQTLANRMTTAPDQVFVACNPLQAREEELATSDLYELQGGGAWIEVVKWVIVTLASFEAGDSIWPNERCDRGPVHTRPYRRTGNYFPVFSYCRTR